MRASAISTNVVAIEPKRLEPATESATSIVDAAVSY